MAEDPDEDLRWFDQLEDQARAASEAAERIKQTLPSEEPLTWNQNGLVRLDVVMYAMHLALARVCMRSLVGMVRQKQVTLSRKLAEAAGTFVAGRAAGEVLRKVLVLVSIWVEVFEELKVQREVEQHVRRGCLRTWRELRDAKLSQVRHRSRKSDKVYTRNPNGRGN